MFLNFFRVSFHRGPDAGNRGWGVEELEEGDDWHGSNPVEAWNLRLPGGVFVQCPRVVIADEVGLCRLAWLPNSNNLKRLEVGLQALQPMEVIDDNLAGFAPPSLASFRCDVFRNVGDLEGLPSFVEDMKEEEEEKRKIAESEKSNGAVNAAAAAVSNHSSSSKTQSKESATKPTISPKKSGDSDDQSIEDALQL